MNPEIPSQVTNDFRNHAAEVAKPAGAIEPKATVGSDPIAILKVLHVMFHVHGIRCQTEIKTRFLRPVRALGFEVHGLPGPGMVERQFPCVKLERRGIHIERLSIT